MIGIVAPSSVVPKIELDLGVELLKSVGFETRVHPHTLKSHRFFAGSDEQRAQALYDMAVDPACEIVWCARGGYGAGRILPLLQKLCDARGDPRPGKLLIGYSDATALFDFVRKEWGWNVLHAPMPGLRSFFQLTPHEWSVLQSWISRKLPQKPWGSARLKHVGGKKMDSEIIGNLSGGNLMVWSSLVGTPFACGGPGEILFFEEISEFPYRIDRMLNQIEQAGGFEGISAVVLGDFLDCADHVSEGLATRPKKGILDPALRKPPKRTKPLRKKLDEKKFISEVFSEIGERRGFPVFKGLPVGHGPGHYSLPIGAQYHLKPSGEFELLSWDWLKESRQN